jgi:hypothetical protein
MAAFTGRGDGKYLGIERQPISRSVPSFSQLPQDGTSSGNLGKVGFRDLTTYNVDLEIRPLGGSFRESFPKW